MNAAALASDITRTGHAPLHGIYFDSGKADVQPESEAALEEIAKLLQSVPKKVRRSVFLHRSSIPNPAESFLRLCAATPGWT